MVVHNEIPAAELVETNNRSEKKRPRHISVFAVQSVACGVIVLMVLLLKVAGGSAYESLQTRFRQALVRNEWVSALAQLWDGNPLEQVASDTEIAVNASGFTAREAAQTLGFSVTNHIVAPLATGVITSSYGERIHPIDGTQEFHAGVDIAAECGTGLLAVAAGEVVEIGENDQLGKYVRLRHADSIEILYGHCESVLVQTAETVAAGARVATVGATGVTTGSHVHIAVTRDGVVCDPADVLPLEQYA